MSVIQNVSFANSVTPMFGPSPCYGSFSSTQTKNINPAFPALAVLPVVYDTVDITPFGVSCAVPSADIRIGVAGTYRVLASLQANKTTGGFGQLDMWISVNGTAVPNSATKLEVNQNTELVMTVEWFVDCAVGDLVAINIYSDTSGLQALAVPAAPPVPAIPSIITTVQRIA